MDGRTGASSPMPGACSGPGATWNSSRIAATRLLQSSRMPSMKSCSASFVLVAINARSLVPDYGRLTQTRLPHSAPAVSPLYPPPPWKLPGARVLKLLFETDVDPVLTWLPPKLSRSSPPYAIITAAQFPQSPVGPFSLAAQYIGCRAGFFIRALTLQAVCDTAPALAALREVWGYPCTPGQLELEEKDGGAIA